MQQFFNHTQAYGFNWPNAVNDYHYSKSNLEWGQNPKPFVITHRLIKENDRSFNPILQKYTDTNYENQLRFQEKQNLINTIVKNKDNQLKIEQTYDIINLQDKLKGFENDPNYPKMKDPINTRKNLNPHKASYNIISCLPFSQHHFDKPENRPKDNENLDKIRNKPQYNYVKTRDYDLISTKYKQFHDEKIELEKEINKYRTAKMFYKNNDYNIIKGRFFDEGKEKEFIEKRNESQKNWGIEYKKNLPRCAKGQSDIYNLISLKTVDNNELTKMIDAEKAKKKRYGMRYEVEKNNMIKDMGKLKENKDKCSYQRFKEEDARQYNIINLKDKPYKEHAQIYKKDGISDWEKLMNGAGENNTFKTKEIYRDPYDYTENNIKYDNYMRERKEKLKNLPNINNDSSFSGVKEIKSKIKNVLPKDEKKMKESLSFDKKKFFDKPKNVFYYDNDPNIKKYNYNPNMNKMRENFDKNLEKNERNKKYLTKNAEIEKDSIKY